jgi:LacI family transcriptional regulator
MGTKGPTLHEVADRAGVSIATVSRVARGFEQVSAATRDRVLEAIDDLNYRPSHFGRALVKRRHGALGIVFPGLRGPYYSEVIHGFEVEAVQARMSVMILGTELLREADELVLGMGDRADGLAIMGGTIGDDLIRRIADRGTPLVTMARHALGSIPNVRVDNVSGTMALVRHLLVDHQYDRLAFVGSIDGAPDGADRWAAFVQAHHDAGMAPPDAPAAKGFEETAGVVAAHRLLDNNDGMPRAVVCVNDEVAIGMLSAMTLRGIRVPEDIAITGWDDIPFAGVVSSPLTTVHQPARELGAQTARLLLDHIEQRLEGAREIVLPTELITRASCGCTRHSNHPESPP